MTPSAVSWTSSGAGVSVNSAPRSTLRGPEVGPGALLGTGGAAPEARSAGPGDVGAVDAASRPAEPLEAEALSAVSPAAGADRADPLDDESLLASLPLLTLTSSSTTRPAASVDPAAGTRTCGVRSLRYHGVRR